MASTTRCGILSRIIAFAFVCSAAFPLLAQAPAVKKDDPAAKKEEKELPKPEDISLETEDGVVLQCTYYPSLLEKKAVPVLLIHGWDGSRKDYDRLAAKLHEAGHAVIVPDLRGHGGSTTKKVGGVAQKLSADKLKPAEIPLMVTQDLERVKQFLMTENNAGKLNIELLCVVGADFGSICAVNFTVRDWSWPQLPGVKQGQDVKAMVLISPESQYKTYKAFQLPQYPAVARLSTLLIAGKKMNHKAASEVKRLMDLLGRFHPKYEYNEKDPPKVAEEKLKKRELFDHTPDTTLQGTKLLSDDSTQAAAAIEYFIKLRLVDQRDQWPWTERS